MGTEILLIEDNPNDVELTLRALSKRHLAEKVMVLRDGEEAMEFISQKNHVDPPKVILLDLKLPKVDGLEILEHLKAHERLKLVPVVVLTSSLEERDLVKSYKLGANSYIVKPVDFDKFLRCVEELGLYWLLLNQLPRG